MNKLFFSAALVMIMLMSCKSVERPAEPAQARSPEEKAVVANFSEITGNVWKLTEVRVNGANTGFNRGDLARDGFGEFFTLNFDAENVSGLGAPNRYSAPYTAGTGGAIKILLVRSTMMAAFREPDKLREHDYFNYVQSAYKWNCVNNNLTLYSKIENGNEVVLIFSL